MIQLISSCELGRLRYKGSGIRFENLISFPGVLPGAAGTYAFRGNSVNTGADYYGTRLYQIARDFWPGNGKRHPSDERFEHFATPSTGELHITNKCVCPARKKRHLVSELPSFWQGANPFICDYYTGQEDWCRLGAPTWPIWVPRWDMTAASGDDEQKIEKYRDELKRDERERDKRAAFLYLGWALHLLGDMSMPDHVLGYTGQGHENVEDIADDNLPMRNKDNYEDVDPSLEGIENKTYSEMCNDFGLQANGEEWANIKSVFDRMANYAGDEDKYDDIHDYDGITEQIRTLQELIQHAVTETIKLIACIGPCEMYIDNEEISGTPPEYYSCFIEAGPETTVMEEAKVKFAAEEYIKLKPGFWAKQGSHFEAKIKSYNGNTAIKKEP